MLRTPIASLTALLALARFLLRRRCAAPHELEISQCINRPTAWRTVDLISAGFLTARGNNLDSWDQFFCEVAGLIVPCHESGRLDDFLSS